MCSICCNWGMYRMLEDNDCIIPWVPLVEAGREQCLQRSPEEKMSNRKSPLSVVTIRGILLHNLSK